MNRGLGEWLEKLWARDRPGVLGGLGLLAAAAWVVLSAAVKEY